MQALAIILTSVRSLQTTPFAVLVIMSTTLVTQLILLYNTRFAFRGRDAPNMLDALVASAVVVLLLRMPLRSPQLPSDKISPPFDPPSHDLRSPEDNLTLWQFMTVSWMSPLISLGAERQLNEEDVWGLGWEFQHRLLHERFKELKGSITKRLLVANGLDLVITSLLAVIELIASTFIMHVYPRPLFFRLCSGSLTFFFDVEEQRGVDRL